MASVMVTVTRGGIPIFYFDSGILTGAATDKIQLNTGSIWIPTQLFVSTAPAPQFLALKIASGQLSFSSTVNTSSRPIDIASNLVLTVSIKLERAQGTPINASFQGPDSATFILQSNRAFLQAAGNAKIGAFGASVDIAFPSPSAFYDADLEKVAFAGQTSSSVTISNGHTGLVDFSGLNVGLYNGAWVPDVQIQTPSTTMEALGTGTLAAYFKSGLQVSLANDVMNTGLMECGACNILVNATELSVSGANLKPLTRNRIISISENSSIALSLMQGGSNFRYSNISGGDEKWMEYAPMRAMLDQPRNVRNERATLQGVGALVLSKSISTSVVKAEIDFSIDPKEVPASGSPYQSYALKNLFLKAEGPKGLALEGSLKEGKVDLGSYRLISNLRYVLPFLPDPYVTNMDINWGRAVDNSIIGDLEMHVSWDIHNATTVNVTLPPGTLDDVLPIYPTGPAQDINTTFLQEMQLKLSSQQGRDMRPTIIYGPTLLDVSTNSSQFGVFVETLRQPAPPVSQLYMQAPANRVRAITLPQVEWEPVTTPEPVKFPSEFTFTDSGPAGQLGTNSVTLMPVSPHEVVQGLVNCYDTERTSKIGAIFTMPFGIVSYANLTKVTSHFLISPSFQMVQPTFSSIKFKGGDQVSLRAGGSLFRPLTGATPSLSGESFIMNYPHSEVISPPDVPPPGYTSILGPQASYNSDFAGSIPAGPHNPHGSLVPANRVDLSGFGASMFTDWRNDSVVQGTSQVDLEVIVGRTEREVVVQKMELVYCGAKATRTVVIQRLNNGQMRRQVFLKATGDGTFVFSDPNIKTHTGLVQRVVNIRNMREVNDSSYTSGDIEFWPVQYDCDIRVETTSSTVPILVSALNHRGYLTSIVPKVPPLPASTKLKLDNYVELLQKLPNKSLTLGGPIDCTIKVSNLTVKLTGIGVDMATNPATGALEAVVAAFGMPEFAGHGEWSFLQKQAGPFAPTHLDNQSVPIIRENKSTTPGSIPNVLRFADPRDLLSAIPSTDYCILHTTDTVRTLFPRPKVEDGLNEISSVLSPVIADPYALANCAGVFPPLDSCIPLEKLDPTQLANFKLPVDTDGFLSLLNPNATDPANPGTFPSPIKEFNRVLRGGEFPKLTALNTGDITLLINSASPEAATAFKFASQAVKLCSFDGQNQINQALKDSGYGLNELVSVAGDVLDAPDLKPLLEKTELALSKLMDPVKDVLAFLSTLGPLPKLDVHMDADFTIHVNLSFNLVTYLEALAPPVAAIVEEFVDQFDFNIDHTQQLLTHNTKFSIKPVFKIPTPFPPAIAVATATFDAAFANGLPTLRFGLGAGIGVDFGIGPFSAKGYVLVTQTIAEGGGSFSVGTDILVKASVDLFELIKADVVLETKMELLAVRCDHLQATDPPTIWGIAQFTIGIDVSIFLVIDISFHTSGEWRNQFNDGPCTPEDMHLPP